MFLKFALEGGGAHGEGENIAFRAEIGCDTVVLADFSKLLAIPLRDGCDWLDVISNVGESGEGIYKIGITRRLEPMDRVDEQGDASVPF